MKYSGHIIVPPFLPIKVVVMTNKTSHTLKIRKSGSLGDFIDSESEHLIENKNALSRLINGETIIL
ncbi:MAG: hypothetical protein ACKPEN_17795 [Planktothrix sp.]|uniref:hypothetical protein n=1 Tax=Planktothrix sp. TaxID=3088171 RepID=UPI0038D3567A